MALNVIEQIPLDAEKRLELQPAQSKTTLEKLREFSGSKARVLALLAAIATPVVAGCARQATTVEQKEQNDTIKMELQILSEPAPVGMIGIKAFINIDEPLSNTHIELFDDMGNSIYEVSNLLNGVDARNLTFVEEGHQNGSAIVVPGGSTIRTIVVSGRNSQGELVQNETQLDTEIINDTDPFINE